MGRTCSHPTWTVWVLFILDLWWVAGSTPNILASVRIYSWGALGCVLFYFLPWFLFLEESPCSCQIQCCSNEIPGRSPPGLYYTNWWWTGLVPFWRWTKSQQVINSQIIFGLLLFTAVAVETRLVFEHSIGLDLSLFLNSHTYGRTCYPFSTCYLVIISHCFLFTWALASLMIAFWNSFASGAFMAWW